MDKIFENVVRWGAAGVGFVAGLYGGFSESLRVLMIFMVVDYVLGCACAFAGKSNKTESGHFWSRVAFLGILRKGVVMLVVLVAAQLDRAINLGGMSTGSSTMFRTAATFFYIANEGMSIVENAGLLGVPIPKPLRQALEMLRDKSEGLAGDGDDEDPEEQRDDDE